MTAQATEPSVSEKNVTGGGGGGVKNSGGGGMGGVGDTAIFILAGPTACGKSALALELAEHVGGEIISADSCAVYRGMDIGSAKPTAADRARVPHHLLDIRNPDELYSAGAFFADAVAAANDIASRGKIPLAVGGAMMWLQRLRDGMDDLPRSKVLREEIKREMKRQGPRAMHRELRERDPKAASRVHPNDRARIARALEVAQLSGVPRLPKTPPPPTRAVVLFPRDREELRSRIRERLDGMFAAGFVDEVRKLLSDWDLPPDCPALRAVGYRQVAARVRGEIAGESECRLLAWHATCQLAKRQLTWLRRWTDATVADPFSPGARDTVFKAAENFRAGS